MPADMLESEVASYKKHMMPYGLPLDSRKPYTKSDWTVWTATLARDREVFCEFIAPMWNAFNFTPSRVPMTDWYWTQDGTHKAYMSKTYVSDKPVIVGEIEKSFRNRTVQGGLFIKLLEYRGTMKY